MRLVAEGGRSGYQHLLEDFWHEASDAGIDLGVQQPVSAAAFCKARRKLDSSAIQQLVRNAAQASMSANKDAKLLGGRRVFAIDGTRICTQRSEDLAECFGSPSGGNTPQLLACVLFDVASEIPVDACVDRYATHERDPALELIIRNLKPGDILLLDRGYPGHDFIVQLQELGIDFVIRCSTRGTFKGVEKFLISKRVDEEIVLAPRRSDLRARAVRRPNFLDRSNDPFVVLTSLNASEFPPEEILELYRRRWEIETYFRLGKGNYVNHAQFHATTPDGVKQEIYAFLLFTILSRSMLRASSIRHGKDPDRLSTKASILGTTRALVAILLTQELSESERTITRLFARIARGVNPNRKPRSCPRRSYKPRPRWDASGSTRCKTRNK
jgi:hypothetical protein